MTQNAPQPDNSACVWNITHRTNQDSILSVRVIPDSDPQALYTWTGTIHVHQEDGNITVDQLQFAHLTQNGEKVPTPFIQPIRQSHTMPPTTQDLMTGLNRMADLCRQNTNRLHRHVLTVKRKAQEDQDRVAQAHQAIADLAGQGPHTAPPGTPDTETTAK